MDDSVAINRENYWKFRKIYRVLKDDRVRHILLSILWQLSFYFTK